MVSRSRGTVEFSRDGDVINSVLCVGSAARARARMRHAEFSRRLCNFPSRNVKWTEPQAPQQERIRSFPGKEKPVSGLRVERGLLTAGLLLICAALAGAGEPIAEPPDRGSSPVAAPSSAEP